MPKFSMALYGGGAKTDEELEKAYKKYVEKMKSTKRKRIIPKEVNDAKS
jgi:uncharacterized protein YifE (UPF0438 family)